MKTTTLMSSTCPYEMVVDDEVMVVIRTSNNEVLAV